MTLRELCNELGVSRRTIQRYEVFGLISPSGKTNRGYLLYDEVAFNCAKRIKEYQSFGFTLNEIKKLEHTSHEERKIILQTKLDILKSDKEKLHETIKILEKEIEQL